MPPGWDALSKALFGHEAFNSFLHGKDRYAPQQIDYFVGFRPPPGFLKTLPRLKAIFSLGAGVDGFLRDPEFPRHLPLVRFVDETLQREMAQYVTMHSLIIHRQQRAFDAAQKECTWQQRMLTRPSREVRIGILGMGDIGAVTARAAADVRLPGVRLEPHAQGREGRQKLCRASENCRSSWPIAISWCACCR